MNDGDQLYASQRWNEVLGVLDRLEDLDPASREKEIERIAKADHELASIARRLIADTDRNDASSIGEIFGSLGSLNEPNAGPEPESIGPFKLLRRIGEGGMGTVYLAERQGKDFVQQVALKLLDVAYGPGARLAARERRILSALTHPNIAHFVDAGVSDGRAWLAMEYVDGEPLLSHCDRLAQDVRERVRLFDQVCAAVAYAHARLIVHRDLKPGNVLVASDGSVKLLDFGIARVLDDSDGAAPATRVFTPEYAAPEQLRGDIATTATDVHGLGLMLYELVSGARLPTLDRVGSTEEWTATELAKLANKATTHRDGGARARNVGPLLRGDLGRIIEHALVKEPASRYASVASLREDLARWLDHRPVSVARPGFTYLASRFVRRHRLAVALTALAIVTPIAISFLAIRQAHRATQMAERAEHAKTFLAELFLSANPFDSKHGGKNAVDLLHDAAQRLDSEFSDDPDQQIDLRLDIAQVLYRLGEPALARSLTQASVTQLRRTPGVSPPRVGVALVLLAAQTEGSGDVATARQLFAQGYAILRSAGNDYRKDRIAALTGMAKTANMAGDRAQAHLIHESILSERLANEGPDSPDIAMDLMNLAADELYAEHFAQAQALAQRAHDMLARTLGAHHPRSLYVDNVLGLAQSDAGHADAGVATLTDVVKLAHTLLQPASPMLGDVISSLGKAQFEAGDDLAAIATLREAHAILVVAKDQQRGRSELTLGLAELRARDPTALQTLQDTRTDLAAFHSAGDAAYAALAQAAFGAALAQSGDASEGERLAREARTNLLATPYAGSAKLADIDLLLASLLDARGANDEAHGLREEALLRFRTVLGAEHPQTLALEAKLLERK